MHLHNSACEQDFKHGYGSLFGVHIDISSVFTLIFLVLGPEHGIFQTY